MICRFCGNKTDNTEKCDCCSEKNVVLLKYRSIKDDSVIQKLSSLFDLTNDEKNETLSQNENNKIELSSETTDEISEIADSENQMNEQTLNEKPDIRKIDKNIKRTWIISGAATVFVGVICFLVGMRCGITRLSRDTDIMSETIAPTASSEVEETTNLQIVETENKSETEVYLKISGKYYEISNSDYAENSNKLLVNIFGYQPVDCSKMLLIADDAVLYDMETGKIDSESAIFQEFDKNFLTTFDFQKITGNSDVDDTDEENEELYIFQVKNSKVDAVVLCNELNGLSYGEIDEMENESGEKCTFSIIDNERNSSVSLYENTSHEVFLRTSYEDETTVLNAGSGDIIIDSKNKYKIIRLSIEDKYYYFYQKYDVQTVYMVQYVKYNTAKNVVQETTSDKNEGEV